MSVLKFSRLAAAKHLTVNTMVWNSIPTQRNELFLFPRLGNKTIGNVKFRTLTHNVLKFQRMVEKCQSARVQELLSGRT